MAIFGQLSPDEIRKQFTHYALFCGVVPVYFAYEGEDDCHVAVRNWLPEWLMDAVAMTFGACIALRMLVDGDYEPGFPFTITGEIV